MQQKWKYFTLGGIIGIIGGGVATTLVIAAFTTLFDTVKIICR